ncbi:MAG: Hercynine oxygenase [Anaerolineae bacterium]|nr:Hercynine oxygenase [Anaerolineae bacterium]
MSNDAQIEKLQKAIAAQETLRGIVPDEQIEATISALQAQIITLSGVGNIVLQGSDIEAGERAVVGNIAGGHLITGDGNTFIDKQIVEAAEPNSTPQRNAYLNRLLETCGGLSLIGIDPKAASSQSESRLELSAVYTALLTSGAESGREMALRPDKNPQESRRISALEQLDRHHRLVLLGDPGSGKTTFVDFVAMCLAGELLGQETINLTLLTAPLPDDEGNEQEQRQPWRHGALLPVKVVLRDFAARGLPPVGETATAEHLWRFIVAELKAAALGIYAKPLSQTLLKEGGLLLLDGLDEVPEADARRVQIKQAVTDFSRVFGRCRILVTSRTYAYQQQDWRLQTFEETLLAPFSPGQIVRFVDGWYRHIAVLRGLNRDDAQGRAELLKRAIASSSHLSGLAQRPLLLTLMASLHAWRGGSLPEKREELYADTVDLLLDWWESPKIVRNKEKAAVVLQPSLAEWLKVDREQVRRLLNRLAYEAHRQQPELTGTADVAEAGLVTGLLDLSQNPDVKPKRLIEYLRDRAGLLLPRGVGVYTFPHRTFQEYLAACHLTDTDYPDTMATLARQEPNRWREVALLAGAKAARGASSAAWLLAEALCYREVAAENLAEDTWGALLAGHALIETANVKQVSERNQPKLDRVKAWLANIVEGTALPAVERAAAGVSLAHLGDPRPGVGLRPDGLPDIVWCDVPAGSFLYGDDRQLVDLLAFWISQYPVTNTQYNAFVEVGGYKNAAYWQVATADGVWRDGLVKRRFEREGADRPVDFGPPFNLPNHPVIGITWYEALAFCAWLTERIAYGEFADHPLPVEQQQIWDKIQSQIVSHKSQITLPTEQQWEKAARGTDGREYPWGDKPDPEKASYLATQIGTTSAVGCFSQGESVYGCQEMSGNAWEWCHTMYNTPASNRLEGGPDVRRVLRGGVFNNDDRRVRCSFRSWFGPDYGGGDNGFRVCVSSLF